MVGSGAAIAADLLAVSVLISITRQLWDTRVAKKAKRTLQTTGHSKLGMALARPAQGRRRSTGRRITSAANV